MTSRQRNARNKRHRHMAAVQAPHAAVDLLPAPRTLMQRLIGNLRTNLGLDR